MEWHPLCIFAGTVFQVVRKFSAVFALIALLAPAAGAFCMPEPSRHCEMAAQMSAHACCDVTRIAQCECQQPDHNDAEPAKRLSNGSAAYSTALTATPDLFVPAVPRPRARRFEVPPLGTSERLSLLATLVI